MKNIFLFLVLISIQSFGQQSLLPSIKDVGELTYNIDTHKWETGPARMEAFDPITTRIGIGIGGDFAPELSGVPTFHCVGFYGTGLSDGKIQYREVGSGVWSNGYELWKDSRAIGGRPANEYRGSVVGLRSGTTYEFQVGGATTKVTTWSESFPVGSTTNLTSPTTINTSGTPTAWRVYTGNINGGTNNITINASYIIIRNMTLTGAGEDAILLGQNAHDVVIEGCDISGWGYVGMGSNNQGAVRIKGFNCGGCAKNVTRIIVQRNKIHDSRDNSNSWDAGGHPLGPNAITFDESGGNHVIRYNDIYTSSASRRFMDGIGGGDNFTYTGAPGANSDIYGNSISNVYDDAIEAEGGGCNVRIWGNFINNTFTGIATATVSVGPTYVFNNVSNVSQRSPESASNSAKDNEDRGPFNKNGSNSSTYAGGRLYLFHNTVLQPQQSGYSYGRGMSGGPVDNGGSGGVKRLVDRNNIWQVHRSGRASIGEYQSGSGENDYGYDLYNGSIVKKSSSTTVGMISGTPIYRSTVGTTLNSEGYFLADNSPGKNKAQPLNNFNNGGGDFGAYNRQKLEFGITAYLNAPPEPPTNILPVAKAGNDQSITLPTNSVTLSGSGTDADGSIIAYKWEITSGNSNYTLGSPNSASTTLSNLTQGTYPARLTVTDNKGATGIDSLSILVNPAPPDPTKVFPVYQNIIIKYSDSTSKTIKVMF